MPHCTSVVYLIFLESLLESTFSHNYEVQLKFTVYIKAFISR